MKYQFIEKPTENTIKYINDLLNTGNNKAVIAIDEKGISSIVSEAEDILIVKQSIKGKNKFDKAFNLSFFNVGKVNLYINRFENLLFNTNKKKLRPVIVQIITSYELLMKELYDITNTLENNFANNSDFLIGIYKDNSIKYNKLTFRIIVCD